MNAFPQPRGSFFVVDPPKKQPEADPTYVVLGAYGDICIMLPLFYMESLKLKKPVSVVVSKAYASIFDGTSYISPIIWPGEYSQVNDAVNFIRKQTGGSNLKFLNPVVVQAYGHPIPRETDSFAKEMWRMAGRVNDWDRLPLVFDKRDAAREAELVAKHAIKDKPMILVAPEGRSSPFPSREKPDKNLLLDAVRNGFPEFNVVDLSGVQCERIYDLLGLYDAAALLVSVDTVHLHLARASKVPVAALCVDGPTGWHGSPAYSNQIIRIRYREYPVREAEMLRTMRECVGGGFRSLYPARTPTLVHVYYGNQRSGDPMRRHRLARRTWGQEMVVGDWVDRPISDGELTRNSETELQDPRKLPFIKDLVPSAYFSNNGIHERFYDDDVIVLTNDDICFSPGLTQNILKNIEAGSLYAHRWDFLRLVRPLDIFEIRRGVWSAGSDLFAFTVGWWKQHRDEMPDMLLGCEFWDCILRQMVKRSGGRELHEAIYHERHSSQWWQPGFRTENPGQIHNTRLAQEWFKANHSDDKDPWRGTWNLI